MGFEGTLAFYLRSKDLTHTKMCEWFGIKCIGTLLFCAEVSSKSA